MFVHTEGIFVITGDCFVGDKDLKGVHYRFVENRNLFVHAKIRKTNFFSSQITQSLVLQDQCLLADSARLITCKVDSKK